MFTESSSGHKNYNEFLNLSSKNFDTQGFDKSRGTNVQLEHVTDYFNYSNYVNSESCDTNFQINSTNFNKEIEGHSCPLLPQDFLNYGYSSPNSFELAQANLERKNKKCLNDEHFTSINNKGPDVPDIQEFITDLQFEIDQFVVSGTMGSSTGNQPASENENKSFKFGNQIANPANLNKNTEDEQNYLMYIQSNSVANGLVTDLHSHSKQQDKTQISYAIVRHSELIKPFHNAGDDEIECEIINLDLPKSMVDSIILQPWSDYEIAEGRRIVRIDRVQHKETIQLKFSVVNPNIVAFPLYCKDAVEVSCLEFRQEGREPEYVITSVEVLKIVILLTGNRKADKCKQRFERARIRSNLIPFWNKFSPNSRDEYENKLHQDCIRRSMYYRSRKPIDVIKDVRLMRWQVLPSALERAMLFYRIVKK